MHELPKPTKNLVRAPKDPTAASQTWAIALVTSAILLLVAIVIVVWLVFVRSADGVATIPATPVDPSIHVKSVTFVLPADMPATYIKNDQSKTGESVVFYDDEGSMCSIMLGTVPVDAAKTPQETTLDRLGAAFTPGVTTKVVAAGERFVVKDADAGHNYSFESVLTEQAVDVPAVGHPGRQQVTLFKTFGNHVVMMGYGCKTETWTAKQAELAAIIAGITLKTER